MNCMSVCISILTYVESEREGEVSKSDVPLFLLDLDLPCGETKGEEERRREPEREKEPERKRESDFVNSLVRCVLSFLFWVPPTKDRVRRTHPSPPHLIILLPFAFITIEPRNTKTSNLIEFEQIDPMVAIIITCLSTDFGRQSCGLCVGLDSVVTHMPALVANPSFCWARERECSQDRDCDAATRCNMLQHTATRCNTLQHTTTHCNTLQHTAAH